nr:unnamed protein product [Haemonchus contortus]
MHSFSFSVQETPSSIMPPSAPTDEFDEILQDVEAMVSSEGLEKNSERSAALFSSIQNDANNVIHRMQNLPNRIREPIRTYHQKIAERRRQIDEGEKENAALVESNEKLRESVRRCQQKVQNLREAIFLMENATAEQEKVVDAIHARSSTLERIAKTTRCAYPQRDADSSEN